MTDLERARITFSDVLVELQGWLGEQLTVYADYGHYVGGVSFEACLERVCPVASPRGEVSLLFEGKSAFAHISPHMTAFHVRNPLTENYWLEFMIGERHVLTIEQADSQDTWIRTDELVD